MTLRGHFKNGTVVLDGEVKAPEGAEVAVRFLKRKKPVRKRPTAQTIHEELKEFIGMGSHLPPDFSVNHDHYLYGGPKRK